MDELEKTAQETAAEEQTGDTTAPDAGEDFETLIRGRYKGEFDARVRKILDGRLRGKHLQSSLHQSVHIFPAGKRQ